MAQTIRIPSQYFTLDLEIGLVIFCFSEIAEYLVNQAVSIYDFRAPKYYLYIQK